MILVVVLVPSVSVIVGWSAESTFTWKLQCTFPPGDQTYDSQMPIIVDAIQTASNGRIKIETFIPGAICAPLQEPISVANGLLECAISSPGNTGQFVPASYAEQGIPFFWQDGQDGYDNLYNYGFLDYLRDEYKKVGLYYGMYVPSGAYGFMTNFTINSVADLKGKKIRGSSTYAEFIKELGAAPVFMGGGDLYMGLKLGTIDGCIYTLAELGPAKFQEVVTDIMLPFACGCAPANFIIGQKTWDALPVDLQEAVNKAMQDSFMRMCEESAALEEKVFKEAKAYGVRFTRVSDENLKPFYDAALRTSDYVRKKYPAAGPGLDILEKWKEAQK